MSAGPVGRNPEERIQKLLVAVIRKASHPCCRPAAQLVLRDFRGECWKVASDGTRLEVTPLEAPCTNGYYKMTQDGWTDFEEDCDAVNQARASKINDSRYSAYQRVFGRNPPQMEDAIFWNVEERIGTRTVDDYETHCPAGKSSLGPQTSMETSPAPRRETLQARTACWTTPLVFGDVERMQPRNEQTLFGTRAWSSATR